MEERKEPDRTRAYNLFFVLEDPKGNQPCEV
jgi:hypothetical protein